VESDVDSELLINIPFTSNIKLKGLRLIGGDSDSHPNRIKLFKNRPGMTFDDVNASPDQEFELNQDSDASIEYPIM
jgi:C-terminal proteasome-interacting domain of thioredoxin-like.